MLVPRRKGQLIKLLILVPLGMLLATSVYYQFYCLSPPGSERAPLPSAAALLREQTNRYYTDNSYQIVFKSEQAASAAKLNKLEQNGNLSPSSIRDVLASSARNDIDDDIVSIDSQNSDTLNETRNRNIHYNYSNSRSADGAHHHGAGLGHHNLRRQNLRDKFKAFKQLHDERRNGAEENIQNESDNYADKSVISSSVDIPPVDGALDNDGHKKLVSSILSRVDQRDNQLLALENREQQDSNGRQLNDPSDRPAGAGHDISLKHVQEDATSTEREDQNDMDEDVAVIPPPSDPSGPGELGRPVVLKNLTKEQQKLVNVGWEDNAFNQYVSDIISVNRTLPDVRDPSCRNVKYPNVKLLPPTSVIICFHNEAWSVLLRTVHSILNRSPRRLVKEIILVDDFSTKAHLGKQLEDYVKPLKIVRVVRAKKREGLIRARLLGAKVAKAPVLTFLDSHCECAEGWLEPLLTRIYDDPTAVVCPVIDVISDKTFEYHYKGDANAISVGGFDWNLQFNWHSVPEREKKRRKHPYDPLRSPTMAGGLFSIDKAFFERLGTYDSGFDIWGGENLELSFKTWMCGGTLEILPCSHVGHVFRSRSPYKWRTGVNVLKRNSVRLAEVWMDDYKKYYYDRIGHALGDYGDITDRLELRQKLHCKPFSYFVKEIYPELFIPGEAVAYGEVRNEYGSIKMCLDSSARKSDFHKPLSVYPCHGSGGNQYWLLSRDGEIRRDEACVDYAGLDVVLFPCHGSGGNQLWYYDQGTMLVKHSTSGRCLELARDRVRLQMSDCNTDNEAQKWTFQHYNATLAAKIN